MTKAAEAGNWELEAGTWGPPKGGHYVRPAVGSGFRRIWSRLDPKDLFARFGVATLFVLLSINLLADFQRTHRFTGLLLLVSEALVVVLTIIRRPASTVDHSRLTAAITTVSLVGPPLLRAGSAAPLAPDAVTASIATLGLTMVIAAKMALGRSFGIVPANRGIVATGPYRLVRHPIYAGYLLTHAAFVVAHPQWTNVAIVLVSDAALILRAVCEEWTLISDSLYRRYCTDVKWRLLPGLF